MSTIDFSSPPPNHQFKVSVEREESSAERNVRLFKDVILFLVAVLFVIVMMTLCYNTLVSPASSADAKRWAMSVLSAATGGIIGYLIRR